MNIKNTFKIAAMTAVVAFSGFNASAETRSAKREVTKQLDIFTSLFKQLQTTYVDSIDAEKSMTKAINAMLNDIDPYTQYIPHEKQDEFMPMAPGTYGGIGSLNMQRAGNV